MNDQDLRSTTGIFYKRDIIEFNDIKSLIKTYPRGTVLIPVTPDPDAFLHNDNSYSDKEVIGLLMKNDWDYYNSEIILKGKNNKSQELDRLNLYKDLYDSRLVRPYMVCKNNKIEKMNIKMMASKDPNKKGLIGTTVNLFDYDDQVINKYISIIPIKILIKIKNIIVKAFDKHIGKRKLVIWVPLWQVSKCNAIVLHVIDRIDIVLT